MWKVIASFVLLAAVSMVPGDSNQDAVVLYNYTLKNEGRNDVCCDNADGTKSCKATPYQKLDFVATWGVEGEDLAHFYISLTWRYLNNNASTRSFACPVPCYDNDLVIHGECDTQVVTVGVHRLHPFRFTCPAQEGSLFLDVMIDCDFVSGYKLRNAYLGTMRVQNGQQ